jgi:hypothetical protein
MDVRQDSNSALLGDRPAVLDLATRSVAEAGMPEVWLIRIRISERKIHAGSFEF